MDLQEYILSKNYTEAPKVEHLPHGKLVRFPAPNKNKKNKAAWVINYGEYAIFGDWLTGSKHVWKLERYYKDTEEQREKLRQYHIEALKYIVEKSMSHRTAAMKAKEYCAQCKIADNNHPYLANKKVKVFNNILVDETNNLVIPVFIDNKQTSLQFIYPDGEKRFFPNGKTKGGYFELTPKNSYYTDDVIICEGYATGATIAEHFANDPCVFIAFGCNNLAEVTAYAKNKYKYASITIAGDSDPIGYAKAKEAAKLNNCNFISPSNVKAEGFCGTDFNDLFIFEGGKK